MLSMRSLARPSILLRKIPTDSDHLVRQTFSATAGNMSRVSEAIIQDHKELKDHYARIMTSSDQDELTRYQNAFVWELARHSIGEELALYPAFEEFVSNGKAMADKDRQEHLAVKDQLYKFQKLSADTPDFKPTLKSLMDDLSQHIKEEEDHDLPALEQAITDGKSADLASSFERTKMFVPTRSHPSAPDKPPFETVAGLLAAPLDKLMDIFRRFPAKS